MKRLQRLSRKTPERMLDDNDHVVRDVWCVECGVNLIRMSVQDKCPNCLHPVSDSVHGDYLIHTDPARVRRLAEAARFVRYGAALLGGMILFALVLTLATEMRHRDLVRGIGSVFRMMFAGAMIAPVLAAIGLGTLTNRRSFAYYQAAYSDRDTILYGVGVVLGFVLFSAFGLAYQPQLTTNLLLTIWAVAPVAFFMKQLGQLMRRVPNAELAAYAELAYWGVIISGLALFAVRYLMVIASDNPSFQQGYIASAAVYIIVAGVFAIGAYRLLARVEGVLHKVAR